MGKQGLQVLSNGWGRAKSRMFPQPEWLRLSAVAKEVEWCPSMEVRLWDIFLGYFFGI